MVLAHKPLACLLSCTRILYAHLTVRNHQHVRPQRTPQHGSRDRVWMAGGCKYLSSID